MAAAGSDFYADLQVGINLAITAPQWTTPRIAVAKVWVFTSIRQDEAYVPHVTQENNMGFLGLS
jgi:hypothetical protein